MSAGTWTSSSASNVGNPSRATKSVPYLIVRALGSLKITVAMFSLGILLVLIGTLAQDEQTLAEVKRLFFNSWWATVPIDVFFPVTLFEHSTPYPGSFPFPGGATIGLVLLVNLIAAKATRFSIHGKGVRLWGGLAICALGAGLVTAVIVSGHAAEGLQGRPPIEYDTLWSGLKAGLLVVSLALTGYAIFAKGMPPLAKILIWAVAGLLLALTATVLLGGQSVRLDDPGLRIVWQLLQATIASLVVLVGLWCLFEKRSGNVLIHIGVALLMVGQFVFGDRQVEQRLNVIEGDSTSMVYQQDELELAFIDPSDAETDSVMAIPEALLRSALRGDGKIDRPELPCIVQVEKWMTNSALAKLEPGQENLATLGFGLNAAAIEVQRHGAAGDQMNIASAYLTLIERESQESIGTVLVSQHINDPKQIYGMGKDVAETVGIDGTNYELALRYRRDYKPYSVYLKDVERINYSGSDTPRDYSSRLVITDKETGATIEERTWMNNPIRYRGDTFYQSQHYPVRLDDGRVVEATGLQIVENSGWVIPYICCMMVMVGMFAHFGGTFMRFANRHSRTMVQANQGDTGTSETFWSRMWAPLVCIGLVALVAGSQLRQKTRDSKIDWESISRLPVQHEGRIKPLDTVAQNVLQVISEPVFGGRPYVLDSEDEKRSQVEWLLATMAGQKWATDARVFRVYAKEVRDVFGLEDRGGYRYAYSELARGREKFEKELDPLREKSKTGEKLDFREQKLSQMYQKLTMYDLVVASYQQPNLPLPEEVSDESMNELFMQFEGEKAFIRRINQMHPPAMIPPMDEPDQNGRVDVPWQSYRPAAFQLIMDSIQGEESNPATVAFGKLLAGIEEKDERATNQALRQFKRTIGEAPAASVSLAKVSTERWLNRFNPTAQGILIYLVVLVLGLATLATYSRGLRRTTFWLLVGVFLIHTIAILARMYISGRAPVINLYSSAVFIGWSCVLFCIVLELVYPFGLANLVGGLIGVITLSIARSLDTSDTLHVLAAVLDTQFWLSTHVVTVTAGYAVTLLAGGLGIVALVHRIVSGYDGLPSDKLSAEAKQIQDALYRMSYGAVCFGILFSFVGTVLGGLWADDSWGRFWGWDPKENGALMIVMWNAVVLHARWDKQVGPRGFAILTVLGNIVTAWSWFGTNLLGIGLHNYGFSKSVAYALVTTVVIHLSLVIAALIANVILSKMRSRFSS